MIYYIALTIFHYANMYFHNCERNLTMNRLTNTVAELKREIESIKTQLEQKHILEEVPPPSVYKKIVGFFWPPPPPPQN